MTSTASTTQWQDTYEARLRELLVGFVAQHENAAAAAKQTIADADGWFGMTGPVGYRLGWDGDKIIAAETMAAFAAVAKRYLYADERIPAQEILDELLTDARKLVSNGIQASSSSEWSNMVARAQARAANEQVSGLGWDTLGSLASRATYEAESMIVSETQAVLNSAKKGRQELAAKRMRAKTDASIAKIDDQLAPIDYRIKELRAELAGQLVAAGAPAEVIAKHAEAVA